MAVQDYLSEIQSYTAPARQQMNEAGAKVAETLKGGATLPFKLKEALGKKLDYNKDLIEQRSEAMADYFAAPSEAREKYQDVWNPFKREALVQRYTGQQLAPYQTLSSLLEQRMGSVADVVGQGVAGWQGVTQAAQQMANLAQNQYQSAFNEYAKAAEMQKAADQLALQEKQLMLPYERLTKNQEAQLLLEQQRLAQSGSATGAKDQEEAALALAYLEMFENGSLKKITDIPAADRGMVVKTLSNAGINLEDIARKTEGRQVEGVINQLYENYTESDLSKGRIGGFFTNLRAEAGFAPKAKQYQNLKEGTLAALRKFVGEKGIMTETDAERIAKLTPNIGSTEKEAKEAWQDINKIFESRYGYNVIPESGSGKGAGSDEDLRKEFKTLWGD